MIKNIKGVDMLGKNHYNRFRNANKISVITTNNGIPLSVHIFATNIHDAKIFILTFEKIKFKIIASNKYPKYITADKGYISKNINKYCNNNK